MSIEFEMMAHSSLHCLSSIDYYYEEIDKMLIYEFFFIYINLKRDRLRCTIQLCLMVIITTSCKNRKPFCNHNQYYEILLFRFLMQYWNSYLIERFIWLFNENVSFQSQSYFTRSNKYLSNLVGMSVILGSIQFNFPKYEYIV